MLSRVLIGEGIAAFRKNQHMHLERNRVDAPVSIFHPQDSLGFCRNHCTTFFCILSSDVNVQPFGAYFNG
jgi:hypothetical protein